MGKGGHRLFAATWDVWNSALERGWLGERRRALPGDLTGHVLDVGAGTGANLPHLRRATQVTAVEPEPAMRRRCSPR